MQYQQNNKPPCLHFELRWIPYTSFCGYKVNKIFEGFLKKRQYAQVLEKKRCL